MSILLFTPGCIGLFDFIHHIMVFILILTHCSRRWWPDAPSIHPNTLSCDSACLFGKFHHHVVTHVAAHAHCWMKCDGSSTYHGAPLVLPRAAPHRWAMETRNRGSGSPYCEVPFPSDNMILIFIPSVVWCSLAGNPAVTFFLVRISACLFSC